jgi:formylglycine-generating enzyme required for sulfatase activity
MPRLCSSLLLLLVIASGASALTMDWTSVGNPGNACDLQSQGCFGAVGYDYSIGTHEVTNAQYAEFLNAKAASDPLGLYNADMSSGLGGITRSGVDGSYTYTTIAGREGMPVNVVSFYDALRFANWMNNGQGNGDTESGSYTLLGPYTTSAFGGATPSNGTTVARNAGATIVLTSEDEWYKAAYHSAISTSYFDYPIGTDTQTVCSAPTATANRANCNSSDVTIVGSYTGSASPYGTFDQGGNVYEWTEAISGSTRVLRGGSGATPAVSLAASTRVNIGGQAEQYAFGFRLAMIPEPGTGLLVIAGLLGLARWGRERG